MTALDYFYDGQLRNWLLQIVRAFSGFQVEIGKKPDGTPITRIVPARMATRDRVVAQIINNNSENAILSFPLITVSVSRLELAPEMRQYPHFVSKKPVDEREFNPTTKEYTGNPGERYTVERYMPVPYNLVVSVDMWTANQQNKHELVEQILKLYNPSISIQTNDNPLDWGAMTYLELTDIQWTNVQLPVQASDQVVESTTLTMKILVRLSPPAKVQQQKLINQIITNIHQASIIERQMQDELGVADYHLNQNDLIGRMITTPSDLCILVNGTSIKLVNSTGTDHDEDGNIYEWKPLLDQYGLYRPSVSIIRLKKQADLQAWNTDVYGTFQIHPTNPNELIWNIDIDSLPSNTLPAINGYINPRTVYPGRGLPNAAAGQRYLFSTDMGEATIAWGDLGDTIGQPGDIYEWVSPHWVRVFEAASETNDQYIVNKTTGQQFRFTNGQWVLSIDGLYKPGAWRLFL